jgi:hypothetical protein
VLPVCVRAARPQLLYVIVAPGNAEVSAAEARFHPGQRGSTGAAPGFDG